MGAGELEPDPVGSEISPQNEKDVAVQEERESGDKATGMKLDPHGFPLQPQPTSDPRGRFLPQIQSGNVSNHIQIR